MRNSASIHRDLHYPQLSGLFFGKENLGSPSNETELLIPLLLQSQQMGDQSPGSPETRPQNHALHTELKPQA